MSDRYPARDRNAMLGLACRLSGGGNGGGHHGGHHLLDRRADGLRCPVALGDLLSSRPELSFGQAVLPGVDDLVWPTSQSAAEDSPNPPVAALAASR